MVSYCNYHKLWFSKLSNNYVTDGPDSNKKEYLTREFVKALYEKLQSVEGTMDLIMFLVGEAAISNQSTQSQTAWLAQIRYLYPEKYAQIKEETLLLLKYEMDTELARARYNRISGNL